MAISLDLRKFVPPNSKHMILVIEKNGNSFGFEKICPCHNCKHDSSNKEIWFVSRLCSKSKTIII